MSLPHTDVDSETCEQFSLEDAELLDVQALNTLMEEFTSYASGLTAALTDIQQMLQTDWNTPSGTLQSLNQSEKGAE